MTAVDGQNAHLIGRMLGVYRLDALLGVGGMAEVYRAFDTELQREVAVKVLAAALALDPGFVDRFRSEGRLVASLNHPHIVPVYQFGEADGLLFLVMPVLKESLRDRLDRERYLAPAEATRLCVQIASALDAAHAHGLVHRDVKPENILLNDAGRALLTDFGLAREVAVLRRDGAASTLAASGLPVGTPEYMAPEQLRGLPLDQRADIYGLGAVLYESLTGVVPHDAPTPYEVASLVLTMPTTPPSTHNPQISPELDAVVLRALAKEPEQRFADARSFALALRQVVVVDERPLTDSVDSVDSTDGADGADGAHPQTPPHPSYVAPGALPAWLVPLNAPAVAGELSAAALAPAPLDATASNPPIATEPIQPHLANSGEPDVIDNKALAPVGYGADGGYSGNRFGVEAVKRQSARQAQPRRRTVWLLMSAGVILALTLGLLGAALLGGFNTLGPGSLGGESAAGQPTAPLGSPGSNGLSTLTPQRSTVVANGTSQPGVTVTTTPNIQGTTTAGPQATATITSTTTPTSQPPTALEISPTDITLQNVQDHTCQGTVSITNTNAQTVGWTWTNISPQPDQFYYQLQSGSWLSGMPSDPALAGGQTDTLTVQLRCKNSPQYTVSVDESIGGSTYTTVTITIEPYS